VGASEPRASAAAVLDKPAGAAPARARRQGRQQGATMKKMIRKTCPSSWLWWSGGVRVRLRRHAVHRRGSRHQRGQCGLRRREPAGARDAAAAAAAAAAASRRGGAAPPARRVTFDVSDIAILTSGKDPFIPNGPAAPQDPTAVAAAAAARQQAAAAAAAAAARQQAVAAAGRGPADLGGLIRLPRPGFSAAAAPPNFAAPAAPVLVAAAPAPAPAAVRVAPAPAPLPEPPTYTVTGLVRDESPDACGGKVAILRGGATGDERRFVRCGGFRRQRV
jgi:hypothetical protein